MKAVEKEETPDEVNSDEDEKLVIDEKPSVILNFFFVEILQLSDKTFYYLSFLQFSLIFVSNLNFKN